MGINSKHSKVSGSNQGEKASFKKDGYASGSVPKSMIPSKPGKTNKKGYSGPPVATGKHDGA